MALVNPRLPTNVLKFYSGVPFDSTYTDVLHYTNVSAFHASLEPYVVRTLTDMADTRLQDTIRVGIRADQLYSCNYMSFRTRGGAIQYIYCFITSIAHHNDNMSEISYTIDWWHTFYRNITIQPSFVVRMHEPRDTVGANLTDEGLPCGEYLVARSQTSNTFGDRVIVLCRSGVGRIKNNIYSGVEYLTYPANTTGVGQINNVIREMTQANRADEILSIFMSFSELVDDTFVNLVNVPYNKTGLFEGYLPRNQKMYTFPYSFLYGDACDGDTHTYRWEFFPNDVARFHVYGDSSPTQKFACYPYHYKGQSNILESNFNEGLTMSGLPQCAFNIDSYKAWFAQNSNQLSAQRNAIDTRSYQREMNNNVGGITGAITSAISKNPMGVAGSVANMAMGSINNQIDTSLDVEAFNAMVADKSRMPQDVRGTTNSNTIYSNGNLEFHFRHMCVTYEYAERIDSYFTRYGYKQNRIILPNFERRRAYTYIRCTDPSIKGHNGVPFEGINQIKKILTSGTTVWRNMGQVGNFMVANESV